MFGTEDTQFELGSSKLHWEFPAALDNHDVIFMKVKSDLIENANRRSEREVL